MSHPTIISYLVEQLTTLESSTGPLTVSSNVVKATALTNAYAGDVGVLEASASTDGSDHIVLPEDTGATARADGLVLRFHHNSTTSGDYYAVYEFGNAVHLFDIYAQESYSMVWRDVSTEWLIISGITR